MATKLICGCWWHLVFNVCGLLLLAFCDIYANDWFYRHHFATVFQGFAVACFFLPLTTISFSGLPDNKFANASSMSNFFRTLSGSVGTSLTMTLWGRRESLHHSQLTATIDQFNPVFNSSSQIMDKYYGSLSGVLNEINNEITQQSLSISANEIFRMAAIAFILLTVLVWFAKPPFTAKGVGWW